MRDPGEVHKTTLDEQNANEGAWKSAWIFRWVEPIADGVMAPANHIPGDKGCKGEFQKRPNSCRKKYSIG